MHRKRSLAATAAAGLMALTLSMPALAATSVVTDPAGDTLFKAPGFMDILRAELAEESGTFYFLMTVAAAIPNDPRLPKPANASIRWAFPIDSDPATFPEGDPFPSNQPGPSEFNTRVFWDGSGFTASLLDRRPLLEGGEAILTPLAFTVSGAEVRVAIPEPYWRVQLPLGCGDGLRVSGTRRKQRRPLRRHPSTLLQQLAVAGQKENPMRTRHSVAAGAIALTVILIGTVSATLASPAKDVTPLVLARGTYEAFKVMSYPPGAGMFKAEAKQDVDVVVRKHDYLANSYTGWHAHPYPVFVTVTIGTLTFYEYDDPTCTPIVVTAGHGYVDSGRGHIGRNESGAVAQDISVIIAPVGQPFRIELPAPGPYCGF